jgi:hypothetical protein
MIIKAGSAIRIDSIRDEHYIVHTIYNEGYSFDLPPGSPADWILYDPDPEDGETVADWIDKRRWAGTTPCLTGLASFKEGHGPWFTLSTDWEIDEKR